MKVIALTGGIAAGKSSVAKMFAELGAAVIDADQLARKAVQPGTRGFRAVVDAFGDDFVDKNGELNRAMLGSLVFSNSEKKAALERIVHPEVKKLFCLDMAELAEAGHETLIYEIPLLLESSQQHSFDAVIVAHAPAELREKRLVELRGFTPEDAAARVAAQVSDKSRLEIADWIIDTACDAAKTRQQVAAVWQQIAAS